MKRWNQEAKSRLVLAWTLLLMASAWASFFVPVLSLPRAGALECALWVSLVYVLTLASLRWRRLSAEERRKVLANFSPKTYLTRAPGWPRFWELLGFCLPRKTQDTVYEPGRNELLEDYLLTRRKYRTKWARRWLAFCFTFRTILLVADCWRVLLASGAGKVLLGFIPEAIRAWWNQRA